MLASGPKPLDWLAPAIITVGLGLFVSLRSTLSLVLQHHTSITWQAILYILAGLAILVLLFVRAPSPSPAQRRSGIMCLGAGLLLTIPHALTSTYGPVAGSESSQQFFANLISGVFHATIVGLVIIGWFVLRGYPRTSLAWLAPLPFVALATHLIFLALVIPNFPLLVYSPVVNVLLNATLLFVQVAFVMFFANATVRDFQHASAAAEATRNAMSIVSFIFVFGLGIIAIIMGHMALKQVREMNDRGGSFAIAGITLG